MDIRNKPNSHVHPLLFLSLENVYSLSHSVTGWAHNANQSAPVRFHVREITVWLALERGTTFLRLTFCKLIPPFSTLCNVISPNRQKALPLALQFRACEQLYTAMLWLMSTFGESVN